MHLNKWATIIYDGFPGGLNSNRCITGVPMNRCITGVQMSRHDRFLLKNYCLRNGEEEPMSVDSLTSPPLSSYPYRRHRRFLSESDESASATLTEVKKWFLHVIVTIHSFVNFIHVDTKMVAKNWEFIGDFIHGYFTAVIICRIRSVFVMN